MLLGLRRYGEAQRHFPAAERPLEWALCAAKLGHHGEAARVLSESGRPVLAALELEAAGASAAARLEWERVLADPRLAGRPYETALATSTWARCCCGSATGWAPPAPSPRPQRLLEAVADDFETRGEPLRAFDCYSVLLRLGKETDSFENVSEGYLNAIRVLAAEDQQFWRPAVLRRLSGLRRSTGASGTRRPPAAREAADYSLQRRLALRPPLPGPSPSRPGRGPPATTWPPAARSICRPTRFHAAIDAATSLGDFELCGRLYAEMAELPLAAQRRSAIGCSPSATGHAARGAPRRRRASRSTSAARTPTWTSGDRT